MKKIMIAVAVVAMAVASQAAVIKWGTTSAVTFGGTKLGSQWVLAQEPCRMHTITIQ